MEQWVPFLQEHLQLELTEQNFGVTSAVGT